MSGSRGALTEFPCTQDPLYTCHKSSWKHLHRPLAQPADLVAVTEVSSDGIRAMAGMCLARRIVLVVQLAHIVASDLLPPISCDMIHCTCKVQGSDFTNLLLALWTWQAPGDSEVQRQGGEIAHRSLCLH